MSKEYPCVYWNDGKCKKFSDNKYTGWCVEGVCQYEAQSNADRIRAMSDEELAEWMHNGISTDPCDYCEYNNGYCDGSPCRGKADAETIIEWLKQPAE